MFIHNMKFTVRHSATCDPHESCDCIDSCEVGTETQELSAMDIVHIGVNENAWAESIVDAKGRKWTVCEIFDALEAQLQFVDKRNPEMIERRRQQRQEAIRIENEYNRASEANDREDS